MQAIPQVLSGRDLCGIAQTGTGKTAAFSLPLLQKLSATKTPLKPKHCRALILSPTRELAIQIADNIRNYSRFLRVSVSVIFGGVPVPRHERELASGKDILVATPGRLLDLVDRRSLNLSDVEYLVLDEADQMLDLGFIHALKRIVKLLPKQRQSLFFSATMPKTIATLAAEFLHDPVQVAVTPVATTAERVRQEVVFVETPQKQAMLEYTLNNHAIERALIFTRTKHGADRVVRHLARANIKAAAIHGNKSQPQREKTLSAFRSGECPILIATDIAARGIDVDGVSVVINFDLPNVPESYVHRIGRTARAGAEGLAISFCNKEERAYLRDIERLIRQKVPVLPTPPHIAGMVFEPVEKTTEDRGRKPQPRKPKTAGGQERKAQPRKPEQGKAAPVARHEQKQGMGKPTPRATEQTKARLDEKDTKPHRNRRRRNKGRGPENASQKPRAGHSAGQGRPSRSVS